ncbi:ThiF family adenylyltransferase [Chryseobacterium wanjuense]
MSPDTQRYSCQIKLPGFGIETQKKLTDAKVLIIGAGGLGCPVLQYLVSSGIGYIGIADDDRVSTSNLHRQILYSPEDVGKLKAEAARDKLQLLNSEVKFAVFAEKIDSHNILNIIGSFDIIVDGTDNFETKNLINDACVLAKKPWVYGAIYQYEGQVSSFNVLQNNGSFSPNYRDLFSDSDYAEVQDCREGGVIPTLAGVIGCMQANEVIKYFSDPEKMFAGKLWLINLQDGATRTIRFKSNPQNIIKNLQQTVSTVNFEEFKKEYKKFELIDVREEKERNTFNIGGKHIPLGELENHFDDINISLPVLCYCMSGKRSLQAAKKIQSEFPEAHVFSLKNGIQNML